LISIGREAVVTLSALVWQAQVFENEEQERAFASTRTVSIGKLSQRAWKLPK